MGAADPVEYILTPASWKELVAVNVVVNHTIKPMTDLEHYGATEHWAYPDDGYGDCEDYVLLKRRMLMERGWPSSALFITTVIDVGDGGHAVLMVRTDRGDFVLNNLTDKVVLWSKARFKRYIKRQSKSDPNKWVGIKQADPPVGSLKHP